MLARVPPDPLHMEGQTALLCPFRELQGNQVIPAVAIDAALGAMRPLPPVEDRSRRRMVEVILEAAAPHMLAEVSTITELDALPRFTVIRSSEGAVFERHTMWHEAGSRDLMYSPDIALPAKVLQLGWGEE